LNIEPRADSEGKIAEDVENSDEEQASSRRIERFGNSVR